MKKISIMLAVTMLMSVFSFGTLSVNAEGEENVITADTSWYGDGTATEFSLADAGDLMGFADLVNGGNTFSGKTVKLTADIDMSGVTDFTGIGFYEYTSTDVYMAFSGTFDGNGYKIKNVTISQLPDEATSTRYVGVALFGSIKNATIRNLGVENLALDFPHTDGVSRAHYDCGGLVSHAPESNVIENCYINGLRMNFGNAVSGLGQVGAIIGKAQGSGTLTINNTYVANFDSFRYWAGGGSVALGSFVGTIAGAKRFNSTNCYAAPIEDVNIAVNGSVNLLNAGAVNGTHNVSNFVSVSWCENPVGNLSTTTGAYLVTNEELKGLSAATLPSSFKSKYVVDHNNANGGYPVFASKIAEADPFTTGTGTEADPYIVDSESSLRDFAKAVNAGHTYEGKFVKLAKDIELAYGDWTPIGYFEYSEAGKSYVFMGTFDGDGYTVSNIDINRASTEIDSIRKSTGFFGCIQGTIKNLGLKDVTIDLTGSGTRISYVGGFVGRLKGFSRITNCYLDGFTVKLVDQGQDQYGGVGGIVGHLREAATINGCYVRDVSYTHTGTKSHAYLGGLVGLAYNKNITLVNTYVHGFTANVGAFPNSPGAGESWAEANTIAFWYVGDPGVNVALKEGTAVTEDELKTLTGNAAGLATSFDVASNGVNDGYPVLKTEKIWAFNNTGDAISLAMKGTYAAGTKLILAVYGDDDRMVDASMTSTEAGLLTDLDLSGVSEGTYQVKGFLWDAEHSPIKKPFTTTVTVQ